MLASDSGSLAGSGQGRARAVQPASINGSDCDPRNENPSGRNFAGAQPLLLAEMASEPCANFRQCQFSLCPEAVIGELAIAAKRSSQ